MKVGMIGCGKLGLPCAEVMAQKYEVCGFDPMPFKSNSVTPKQTIKDLVNNSDLIFIAVPTPHDKQYGGETPSASLTPKNFDYTQVINVLSEVNKHANKSKLVVLISTVLPGTIRRSFLPHISNFRFIYNPYLIAMGSVKWDMKNPECLIIGTRDGDTTSDAKILCDFYAPLMENKPRINIGTWDEAECIKIFYNTYISMKLSFVNMIQDVAEKNGNINVDIVTDALKEATQRITGPRYLTAGMGDAGACHPRDNIALSWLASELDLGYDLFKSIMESRELQAKNLAKYLVQLSDQKNMPIAIHGKAYKPKVHYPDGSYSLLIGHYVEELGKELIYIDPLTGDMPTLTDPHIILMAHSSKTTYFGTGVTDNQDIDLYIQIPKGSIVVDPWRKMEKTENVDVIHYGNTRSR